MATLRSQRWLATSRIHAPNHGCTCCRQSAGYSLIQRPNSPQGIHSSLHTSGRRHCGSKSCCSLPVEALQPMMPLKLSGLLMKVQLSSVTMMTSHQSLQQVKGRRGMAGVAGAFVCISPAHQVHAVGQCGGLVIVIVALRHCLHRSHCIRKGVAE